MSALAVRRVDFGYFGRTSGHQSLVVRLDDGTVVVAGQSHDTASDFASDALALTAQAQRHGEPLPAPRDWMQTLLSLDPDRVVFAHDHSVWMP